MDAPGSLVRFVLLPGQRHDMVGVEPLIRDVHFDALLADKAFDADWLRAELDQRGASAVIPPRANRKHQFAYDREMYRWRHLVENYFAKIKEFRGIATRYDKTDTSYRVSMANSYSRGDGEFEKATAMLFPSEIVRRGRRPDHSAAHFRRRVSV